MSSFLDRIDGYVIAAMHIYVHLNNSFTFILQRIHFLLKIKWSLPQKTTIMTHGAKIVQLITEMGGGLVPVLRPI